MTRNWQIPTLLTLLLGAASAAAGFSNGSFESGLAGWTTSGDVIATGFEPERGIFGEPDWTPPDGSAFAALFSTDNVDTTSATLEQSFSATAGQNLVFEYFFDFGDAATTPDFARVELLTPANTLVTLLEFNVDASFSDFANVPWSTFSRTLTQTGNYRLFFSVYEAGESFESILGVDDVRLTIIPTPGAAGLALIGLALLPRRR